MRICAHHCPAGLFFAGVAAALMGIGLLIPPHTHSLTYIFIVEKAFDGDLVLLLPPSGISSDIILLLPGRKQSRGKREDWVRAAGSARGSTELFNLIIISCSSLLR